MSDFEKTNIYRLMQRSNAAWEAHRRDEREWETRELAEATRKRAEKRDQRSTSTPAADPHKQTPGDLDEIDARDAGEATTDDNRETPRT